MKTRLSLFSRGMSRRTRIVIVMIAALLPLTLVAQQGSQGARSLLPGGSAVAVPFTGEGWQDKVLTHEGYVMPPPELAAAVLAPREMNITLGNPSPDRKWFLDEIGDGPVPMVIFGRPFDELGGVFIDYRANRLRSVTLRNTIGLQLVSAADGSRKTLATPANMRVTNARWTPDGTGVMYMTLGEDSSHIWITDVATNKPRQITKAPLLTTFVTNYDLIGNGKQIIAVFPPEGRTARPLPPPVPAGPELSVSMDGDKNRLRTYPSLMKTPYDQTLLEWHAMGQIGIVDVATGVMTKFGKPAMITAVDMSPDAKYARVTRMTKPFSYIVPVSNFGSVEEVWDSAGTALAELSKRNLNLGVQAGATPDPPVDPTNPQPAPAAQAGGGRGGAGGANNGKRDLMWREDGQGFNYLQLEPAPATANNTGRQGRGGNAAGDQAQATAPAGGGGQDAQGAGGRGANAQANTPPRKDRLMHWAPPFTDASAKLIYENPTQMSNLRFSPDGQIMFFTENNATVAIYVNDLATKYTVARGGGAAGGRQGAGAAGAAGGAQAGRGGAAGGGGNQGTLMSANGSVAKTSIGGGTPVMLSADGTSVYFQSGGAGGGRGGGGGGGGRGDTTPPKPFIDKVVIKTGERARLFEGENTGITETISTVIDPELKKLVLSRQNATTPPQQFLYDNGTRKQLTNNEDLFPDLTRMIVQRFRVSRADGFSFRTTIYLPADYKEGTRLPAFFWFYPAEFTSQEQYNGGNDGPAPTPQTFQSFGTLSKQFLVRLGYAVVENDSPIVGAAGEMNNNYVNDLRNNLAATIDELDKRMLVDRHRLAIGGHSYGAFSTVNALVNTPFFKAGIAGDGAYNRTLTPLGVQTERRDLWQAPNVYLDMSPFLKANQLSGALLMYHGMHDQNVGTDPVNSDRLFHALNGLGKTVALYRYPFEDHGPAGRETLLDLWSRWAAWLDKYVKNPAPPNKPAPAATPNRGGGGGGGQ
ncbi:MAG TPA: prolyl oligopeptidase family serine peptidase [Vicinamibacterales bacterium]|nr:prolyl oligopeptidase family serine peptidase [Vicinamibacterales bacterium]